MNKGFSYYYRIECYDGFRNNQNYEGKSFNELYRQFTGCTSVRNSLLKDFIRVYDSGHTNAYYHMHCVLVNPDGSEKVIYTARGL